MMRRTFMTAAAIVALAACGGAEDGAQETGYANDGDTGAAAPATEGKLEHLQPPDSTTGVSSPTGRPGSAGVPPAVDANIAEPQGKNPRP